jgi:xanthine dehydrogenase YagT iron-sulfur-binding subunit
MPAVSETAPLSIGAPVPDVSLVDADGAEVSLRDYLGQSLLLLFFPDDWDPARAHQLAIYSDVAGSTANIAEVSYDGAWCELDVAGDDGVRFPLLSDSGGDSAAARAFGVTGRQAAFVVDAQGCVRWRHVSAAHPQSDELRAELLAALEPRRSGPTLTRREFLMGAVAASLLTALPLPDARAQDAPRLRVTEPGGRNVTLNVNGSDHRLTIDPRTSLLDALRERMGLFGTKKGCDHGQCGACTVHVDGRRVNACLMLAAQAEGSKIVTIEGLARGADLHPVQAAFIKADGFQCGYCTPGQIMSAVACIAEGHAGSEDEVREWMSGNICRCGAYRGICKAIAEARSSVNPGSAT